MKYQTNHCEKLNIIIEKVDFNCICLHALDDSGKEVGYLRFLLINEGSRSAWLNLIEVPDECQHRGIGGSLITIFEYICVKMRSYNIEGRYYPKNNYAKPFYDKYGYDIFYEGYEQYISKRLEPDKVIEKFMKNLINIDDKEKRLIER